MGRGRSLASGAAASAGTPARVRCSGVQPGGQRRPHLALSQVVEDVVDVGGAGHGVVVVVSVDVHVGGPAGAGRRHRAQAEARQRRVGQA
jgi:hypothetical protein